MWGRCPPGAGADLRVTAWSELLCAWSGLQELFFKSLLFCWKSYGAELKALSILKQNLIHHSDRFACQNRVDTPSSLREGECPRRLRVARASSGWGGACEWSPTVRSSLEKHVLPQRVPGLCCGLSVYGWACGQLGPAMLASTWADSWPRLLCAGRSRSRDWFSFLTHVGCLLSSVCIPRPS